MRFVHAVEKKFTCWGTAGPGAAGAPTVMNLEVWAVRQSAVTLAGRVRRVRVRRKAIVGEVFSRCKLCLNSYVMGKGVA